MLDWDANVNPEFAKSNKTKPRPVKAPDEIESEGYRDPLVMLKHFGPGTPEAKPLIRS
jgi:hypothetical protein